MEKLTILTSLSYVMRRLAFEDMLLDGGSPINYIDWHAGIFKRRIEGIRDKYNHFGFGEIEIKNFYSPRFGMKDKQYECEKEISKLVNDSNLYFLNFDKNNDVVQNYITYIKYMIEPAFLVLDVTDLTKEGVISLAHELFIYNRKFRKDFFIEFYNDE